MKAYPFVLGIAALMAAFLGLGKEAPTPEHFRPVVIYVQVEAKPAECSAATDETLFVLRAFPLTSATPVPVRPVPTKKKHNDNTPIPVITGTPDPTETPAPTETPNPTETPDDPKPTKTPKPDDDRCNKGEGNGSEDCDPGNHPEKGNDDEDQD